MSVFIELTTDAFQDTFNKQKGESDRSRRAGTSNARRPLRGLEIKDDTYAILKLVNASGTEIPLIDSGSPSGMNTQYTNFILQSVSESRMEKNQIVETFGESYIFFFGESPRFLDVQAILIDSQDFNWYAEFWENYDKYLRGTKSVEMGARTYLFYDDNIVEGYILQAQASKSSESPLMARLSFRLYLTNYSNISFVGDPNFPVRGSISLPGGVSDINQIQDPSNFAATVGANLQQLGFGGGTTLSDALRNGADPSQVPANLQPILSNAQEAYGLTNSTFRTKPLRQLIAENVDEFTGLPPADLELNQDVLQNQIDEADDLAQQALRALEEIGDIMVTPTLTNQIGLGPRFVPAGVGIGFGSVQQVGFGPQANVSASFGVSSGVNFRGQTSGGVGGGFGLSGQSSSGIGFGSSAGFLAGQGYGQSTANGYGGLSGSIDTGLSSQLTVASYRDILDQNFQQSEDDPSDAYQGGVNTAGLSLGVGIGGGISGGAALASGFRPAPTPLPALSGSGAGASMSVGGVTTAFSMVAADGTLDVGGLATAAGFFSGATF